MSWVLLTIDDKEGCKAVPILWLTVPSLNGVCRIPLAVVFNAVIALAPVAFVTRGDRIDCIIRAAFGMRLDMFNHRGQMI